VACARAANKHYLLAEMQASGDQAFSAGGGSFALVAIQAAHANNGAHNYSLALGTRGQLTELFRSGHEKSVLDDAASSGKCRLY
jgi:hypothetical protein